MGELMQDDDDTVGEVINLSLERHKRSEPWALLSGELHTEDDTVRTSYCSAKIEVLEDYNADVAAALFAISLLESVDAPMEVLQGIADHIQKIGHSSEAQPLDEDDDYDA